MQGLGMPPGHPLVVRIPGNLVYVDDATLAVTEGESYYADSHYVYAAGSRG